ncbi:MAG: ATPase [Acidiphilium sp. 21-68-69]|nr:MAG: ATPase [Acidiphilium sp. 21-68-69]
MKIAFPTIIAASALAVAAFGLTAAHAQSVAQPSVHQISSKKTTIAFLLPENSSPRYEQVDRPWFIKMAHAADPNAKLIVSNANSSPDTQLNQAESAISNGADVLVVDPVDGKAGAAVVNYATRNHVKVISYDRLIQDSKPDYYVSFDNTKVGELQGEYIAKHTKPGGSVMMINGAPTDPNAFDFRKGAMNDGTASGVIRALQAVGLAGKVPVTGQDATNGGLTFILEGLQSMTVFKYVPEEAAAAADLAVAVATGTKPPAGLVNGKVNNKMIDVPSVLLKPLVVTKANIAGSVIKSGYTTWKAICVGPAAKGKICKAHGA